MERHRCTKCRNPIRSVAVGRPGADDDAWYHPDCWAEACASEQENYERQVRAVGLEALLAPDVALPVARDFVEQVTEKAVGQEVLRSVTPGQMVVKIVHDALVEMLGAEAAELRLGISPPAVIMMVGLQGSGKTTTTAKLAKRLSEKERK